MTIVTRACLYTKRHWAVVASAPGKSKINEKQHPGNKHWCYKLIALTALTGRPMKIRLSHSQIQSQARLLVIGSTRQSVLRAVSLWRPDSF